MEEEGGRALAVIVEQSGEEAQAPLSKQRAIRWWHCARSRMLPEERMRGKTDWTRLSAWVGRPLTRRSVMAAGAQAGGADEINALVQVEGGQEDDCACLLEMERGEEEGRREGNGVEEEGRREGRSISRGAGGAGGGMERR
eukprot:371592-Hanusia_phi.AAC.2